MIPHYEEAIISAQRLLQSSNRPEIRQFAQAIISVKTTEVQQMQAWLGERYPDIEQSSRTKDIGYRLAFSPNLPGSTPDLWLPHPGWLPESRSPRGAPPARIGADRWPS